MTQEWAYMNSKQLEKSLATVHKAFFDTLILKNDCEKSNEKQCLPEIKHMIKTYKKIIEKYEAGIITLKNKEVFAE